tara:strand:- start:4775 stop:6400 length:1626 start_codon:yes stop_codon:yes gene_type:complete
VNHPTLTIAFASLLLSASAHGQELLYQTFGDDVGEYFGRTFAGGSDLNGDGIGDLLVGAPRDNNPTTSSGEVHIRSGVDGSVIDSLNFTTGNSNFGGEVRFLGDLDGDTVPDFAVMKHAGIGEVIVHSGATNTVLYSVPVSPPPSSPWRVLSECPDLNGDGIPEFLVGEPALDAATVYSGADGSVVHDLIPVFAGQFGRVVDWIPDVNGDGVADLIVGSPRADSAGGINAGAVTVFSGATGDFLRIDQGLYSAAQFGHSIAALADVDGDGFGDYVVGSPWRTIDGSQVGTVMLVSGGSGTTLWTRQSTFLNSGYGIALAILDDFDGDGNPDCAVGMPFGGFERVQILDVLSGDARATIRRDQLYFGMALESLGDVTGDGRTELGIASSIEDDGPIIQTGSVSAYKACDATGYVVCDSSMNSTGLVGYVEACAFGTTLTLHAGQLPIDEFGFFLMGEAAASIPLFDGILCLGLPFVRLNDVPGGLLDSGPTGEVFMELDLLALPQNTVVLPGETWRFQYWTRDTLPGPVSTADFTSAVAVTF